MIGAEPLMPTKLATLLNELLPYGLRKDVFCPGYGLAEHTLAISAVRPRGYYGGGGLGLVVIVVLILVLMGRL